MSDAFSSPASRPGPAEYKAGISKTGSVKTHFHYWSGASGQAYLHTVYAPDKLPLLVRVIVIVVSSSARRRQVLYIGQAGEDGAPMSDSAEFQRALAQGGNEVHVHFMGESGTARLNALKDLENMCGKRGASPIDLAA